MPEPMTPSRESGSRFSRDAIAYISAHVLIVVLTLVIFGYTIPEGLSL